MNNVYFVVVRYNGLKGKVFKYILDVIESIETIEVKAIYGVKWNLEDKENNLLSFYEHKKSQDAINDIIRVNGLMMAAIILYDREPCDPPAGEKHPDFCTNWNATYIKRAVRSKYGNVVHVSDNTELAYGEIRKLLGLSKEKVDELVAGGKVDIREITTGNELARIFNKIKDGRKTLWTPEK